MLQASFGSSGCHLLFLLMIINICLLKLHSASSSSSSKLTAARLDLKNDDDLDRLLDLGKLNLDLKKNNDGTSASINVLKTMARRLNRVGLLNMDDLDNDAVRDAAAAVEMMKNIMSIKKMDIDNVAKRRRLWSAVHNWFTKTAANVSNVAKQVGNHLSNVGKDLVTQVKNLGQNCWYRCHQRQGPCEWCGKGGKCCRYWRKGNGCSGYEGRSQFHSCVKDKAKLALLALEEAKEEGEAEEEAKN